MLGHGWLCACSHLPQIPAQVWSLISLHNCKTASRGRELSALSMCMCRDTCS